MLAAALAGCTSTTGSYVNALSTQDPKWQSPQCQQARMDAMDYEAREEKQMGWGTGMLFGVYGIAMVASVKDHQRKQRKHFAREVHLQCSSLPLPKELQVDPSSATAVQTKYP
jgi:hypothetical protein